MSSNTEREQVKEKIQKWFLEENFKVQEESEEKTLFMFLVENKRVKMAIYQPNASTDKIILHTSANFSDTQISKLQKMESKERNNFLWKIRLNLLNRPVNFSSFAMPLKAVTLTTSLYYDGLTKTSLMATQQNLERALLYVLWSFDRKLGEANQVANLSYIG